MKMIWKTLALVSGAAMTLSACANTDEAAAGGGDGFSYDAPQTEVDEVLADLEPVTLTYQPVAASPEALGAAGPLMFQEYIEERSGGKIKLDIVWGQAIAPYGEVHNALQDGRLDIASFIPAYVSDEFPAFNDLMAYSHFGSASPFAGQLANSAMLTELAWGSASVIDEFESLGLTVLSPMGNGGEYYMMCNKNNRGVEVEDWEGRTIRAGSPLNAMVISSIGASPVSIEYPELFEALQRNTADCAFAQFPAATDFGVPSGAPHISYMTEWASAGKGTTIQLAGSVWNTLPLAYQQIIFDAEKYNLAGAQDFVLSTLANGVQQALEADGEIGPLAVDVQEAVRDAQLDEISSIEESGTLDADISERAQQSAEKWAEIPGELGYQDGGELADINDWYTRGEVDFLPFTTEIYEEVVLQHRPE